MSLNRSLLAIVLGAMLSACSESTENADTTEITRSDLSLIDIEYLAVKLPTDLAKDEVLLLEQVGEKGVVTSIEIGPEYDGAEYLKVFLTNDDSNSPEIAFVSKKGSTKRTLSLGEAKLTGFRIADATDIGQVFAYASAGGSTAFSDFPKGNDLALRITVKGR